MGDFENNAVFNDAIVRLSVYLVNLSKELGASGKINHIDPELEEFLFLGNDYKTKGIKLPPSLSEQIIPFCVKEGLLDWR